MGYAVEMFFEETGSQPIRRLFDSIDSPLPKIGALPHVSLALFDAVDVSRLIDVSGAFAHNTCAFGIRFSSVGLFSGDDTVVFLAPVVTDELLGLHRSFHMRLEAAGLCSDPYYAPGYWVPHCTITIEEPLPGAFDTIETIHAAKVMGEYLVSSIHVVEFRPVVDLASFDLKDITTEQSSPADG